MPQRAPTASRKNNEQSPEQIADLIRDFARDYSEAAVLEDGKIVFDLSDSEYSLSTEHGRCTLHLWGSDGNMVRRVVSATRRGDSLRLDTLRFGHAQTKLLELVRSPTARTPTARDTTRQRYLRLLQRVLMRHFADWKPQGFRTAMDLERSFGPAYARGSLVRGSQAWAVIGVNQHESPAMIDGILTLGILWLHHCRENAGGRRLYQGLKVIVPRRAGMLTQSRMAWMNTAAAKWELYELDEHAEEVIELDADDTGNLRTRLVHRPDEKAAKERFADAVQQVLRLVPQGEESRVEQRLRSSTELAFVLHGFAFARAHVTLSDRSFASSVVIAVGAGENETVLTAANQAQLAEFVADLFRRRRPCGQQADYTRREVSPSRRIGPVTQHAAHSRLRGDDERNDERDRNPQQDPLYRAAPERWLESVLRQDLAPLTRGIAADARANAKLSVPADDVTFGNRTEEEESKSPRFEETSHVIPRLDPRHVYTQVPAIAGASDRGMLDLLGVTADGRLAVIELKADDDLQLALQGLDYWIRVRHHHLQNADPATGLGEFQRHGYFNDVELSELPPRLYLVAPALHIHPATETILRYLSPRVEWNLLALDERWRQGIRVVWRKSGGAQSPEANAR